MNLLKTLRIFATLQYGFSRHLHDCFLLFQPRSMDFRDTCNSLSVIFLATVSEQRHCSNIRQGGHGISLHWFCWLTLFFRTTVMVPNQNVQDPDTWTLPHVMQLKQEYKKLVENFNCDIQEFVMVQEDPPALPSDTLHLPPLHCLHSATTHNMELPQPGEMRKVQPPSQRTISRQLMKS